MNWRRSLIGLVVSAIFIVLLLRQVSGPELRDAFAAASPGWLAAAFAIYLGALWLRGLRWKLVLRGATPISTSDATALVVIGYAANNVLPVRAGELVRAQLLHERHGADRVAALGTILVERVFDGLVLALFLAGTIALAGGSGVLRLLAAATGVAFVALALALLLGGPRLANNPGAAQRLLRPLPARLQQLVAPRLDRFVDGLTTIRGTGAWSAIFVVTAASWGIEAAMYWLVGIGLGLDLDPLLYLAVCGAANLAIAAPSTSGGIGPFEFFAREVAVVFGATAAAGTAYAIALHALLLIPVAALGLLLLWRRHIGVRGLLRSAPDDAPTDAPAASTLQGSG